MPPPANLDELLATRTYPGMTAAESRLIRVYLARHGHIYDTASVTERVGPGVLLPPHITDQKARDDWERRTKARPDLVLRRDLLVQIVEAKEQLTNEGVWQVLSYRDLFVAEHPGAQVTCVCVSEVAHPSAVQLARSQKVQVYTYAFASPAGQEATEQEA